MFKYKRYMRKRKPNVRPMTFICAKCAGGIKDIDAYVTRKKENGYYKKVICKKCKKKEEQHDIY